MVQLLTIYTNSEHHNAQHYRWTDYIMQIADPTV